MNKFIIAFLFICCTLNASTLTDPHYVRLCTCGEKELMNEKVSVYFDDGRILRGTVKDYTQFDVKIISGNIIYVIPITSIRFIQKMEAQK